MKVPDAVETCLCVEPPTASPFIAINIGKRWIERTTIDGDIDDRISNAGRVEAVLRYTN